MNKKLSIITINYNNVDGLKRTIASVVNQTWQEFEYIIIDGGSTDGSAEYLAAESSNFTYWVSEADAGIYNAMNKGIAKATGEYLLFLNSGDHFNMPTSLQQVQNYFIGLQDFIYFNITVVAATKTYLLENPEQLTFSYLSNNHPCHQCVFIRKELFDRIGYYDEQLKIVSDWKFFILAVLKHNATILKVDTVFSTYYEGGVSSLPENQPLVQAERAAVLEKEFPVLMNDLKEKHRLERVLRNLRKSTKIKWLITLGLIDKF